MSRPGSPVSQPMSTSASVDDFCSLKDEDSEVGNSSESESIHSNLKVDRLSLDQSASARTSSTSEGVHENAKNGIDQTARDNRPFSLAAPETPSHIERDTPISPMNIDEAPRDITRDSTALDSIALSEPSTPAQEEGSRRDSASSVKTKRISVTDHHPNPHDNFEFVHRRDVSDDYARRASQLATDKMKESINELRRSNFNDDTIDWNFWSEVAQDYEGVAKSRPKELSQAIQNGIPSALRGMLWQLMSCSKDPELESVYQQLLKVPSQHEKPILRDLNRTFPMHEYFAEAAGVGQENLFNVLKAYSLYDEEVGYVQGLAFVVGPLLLHMPDEEAFCVLVRLMKSYDLRSRFIPDMPGLQLALFQFDRLLEEMLPAVFHHLLREGVKSSMWASQIFLTLIAYRFPLELVCSVFDLVFAEGVEAIFRFCVMLMKQNEQKICTLEFEQLLDFLKTGLFERYKVSAPDKPGGKAASYEATIFLKEALQMKITPMMLDQYASEWANEQAALNAHEEEVKSLRTVNQHLSVQVRSLETSLAQLNQEHCDLINQMVRFRLEREELEDELVTIKMAYAELSHKHAESSARSSIQSPQSAISEHRLG